ncbi:DMT family transporter [Actinomadura sp. GC306]|uniref:DMT family transporter n=1 Tax=Actinomadura sp. GC306 TaxID=2530367 RepID=UPI001A9E1672|nr:DMT family transporter [Actinomadura sp. GC306]
MNGIAAAFSATGLYYLGFAVFKLAAERMAPLRGNRILHMAWTIVTNWIFLVALAFVLAGLGLQILALGMLPLSTAVPIFMSGIVPLLFIALVFFGERLTPREWLSLVLIGGAILLLTASVGGDEPIASAGAPLWKVAVVVAPAVVIPVLILVLGDYRPDGRHARPITGIAYGLSSGFPVGTAELAIKGWSDHADAASLRIALTPWPYLTVLAAAIGFGIMVMAFQRCRVVIVATVMTVTAKTYLLTMGTFMYGEAWPQDGTYSAMRLGALTLGAIAVLQFPRHRPVAETPRDSADADAASARDLFGDSALGGPALGGPYPGHPGYGRYAAPDEHASHQRMPQEQIPPQRSPYAQDPLGRGPYDRQEPEPGPRPPRRPVRPEAPTETGSDGRWRGFSE